MPHQTKILTLVSCSLIFNGLQSTRQINNNIILKQELEKINNSIIKLEMQNKP
jgi:hypothetical protein